MEVLVQSLDSRSSFKAHVNLKDAGHFLNIATILWLSFTMEVNCPPRSEKISILMFDKEALLLNKMANKTYRFLEYHRT